MKYKKIIGSIVLTVTLISAMSISSLAAEVNYTDNTPYVFSLQSGTEEWSTYKNKADILEQLQIPEEKLNKITTEALLQTVMDYPYISDYKLFNTPEDAYNTFCADFNGFKELLSRDNITDVLFEEYSNADIMSEAEYTVYSSSKKINSNEFSKKFFYTPTLEFLAICDQIHNGEYTAEEEQSFSELVSEKSAERISSGLYSIRSNVYDKYKSSQNSNTNMTRIGAYGTNSYVTTPNGTQVATWYNGYPDVTPAEAQECHADVMRDYPDAIKKRDATVKYNCHSYAWYSQSTSNLHWMNYPNAYMNDGSYYRNTTSPRVGMKAFWPTGGHSGIVSRITYEDGVNVFYITSKWGDYGLYEHVTSNCPYGGAIHFYTRS